MIFQCHVCFRGAKSQNIVCDMGRRTNQGHPMNWCLMSKMLEKFSRNRRVAQVSGIPSIGGEKKRLGCNLSFHSPCRKSLKVSWLGFVLQGEKSTCWCVGHLCCTKIIRFQRNFCDFFEWHGCSWTWEWNPWIYKRALLSWPTWWILQNSAQKWKSTTVKNNSNS